MKKILFTLIITLCNMALFAQTTEELQETANSFMRQGDYSNAIVVLSRAVQQAPRKLELSKQLALAYYYNKENEKALDIIKPLLEKPEIDDQTFQIAANIYKQLDNLKEAQKVYQNGLKRFPESGALYNDYGESIGYLGGKEALTFFEKGIRAEPSFPGNYYNAAKYYAAANDPVWAILLGEIFVNMQPNGLRAVEIKQLLLQNYKTLFSNADLEKKYPKYEGFAKRVLQVLNKQTYMAANGINTESLAMIRTRFVLDWFAQPDNVYPYHLFDYQQQLLQQGYFDAYNQWLFGSSENISAYQNWIGAHATENKAFLDFQKGRVFKMPANQFYR